MIDLSVDTTCDLRMPIQYRMRQVLPPQWGLLVYTVIDLSIDTTSDPSVATAGPLFCRADSRLPTLPENAPTTERSFQSVFKFQSSKALSLLTSELCQPLS